MAAISADKASVPVSASPARRSELLQSWRRFQANRIAVVGLIFILLLLLLAIFAGAIAPYDPLHSYQGVRGVAPSWAHPFGYDHIGRDLLSRVIFGSRVVVLAAVLGPSLTTTVIVIGVTGWARFARVVRADVLSLKEEDFITAARAIGVSHTRIIFRHILPNVLGPVIVLASLGIGGIIILEAALSFLGLGVRPPTPSWGGILADGRPHLLRVPHISFFPGVMITLTVLAFNFLGDGLRDALDPRQRS